MRRMFTTTASCSSASVSSAVDEDIASQSYPSTSECLGKSTFAPTYYPSLEEFKNFSKYVSKLESEIGYSVGVCKVVPPSGWDFEKTKKGYANINKTIPNAIFQLPIRGKLEKGVFSVRMTETNEMDSNEFKQFAESINIESCDKKNESELFSFYEKRFWKSLTASSNSPPLYGADIPGSLFQEGEGSGWNLNALDSLLQLTAKNLLGITTSMLYFGMWRSMFAFHCEDMDLHSINFVHVGEPKLWYGIAPQNASKFEALAMKHFEDDCFECKDFLRHKTSLFSPTILESNGIPFVRIVQRPGEFVITFPKAYHSGFNAGWNIAEAVNFGTKYWLDFGKKATYCQCREDSVRINMNTVIEGILQAENMNLIDDNIGWLAAAKVLKEKDLLKEDDEYDEFDDLIFDFESNVTSSVCSCCSKQEVMELSTNKVLTITEKLLACSSCGCLVHPSCYGVSSFQDPWKCDLCSTQKENLSSSFECVMCNVDCHQTLAMKSMKNGSTYCHLVCAFWNKSAVFENVSNMNQIYLLDEKEDEEILFCEFCNATTGLIQKCPGEKCNVAFHPSCALINKLFFHLGSSNSNVQSEIFCENCTPIALFCVCNLPYIDDGRNMIGCESCLNWFHPYCININPLKFGSYQCDRCIKAYEEGIENSWNKNKKENTNEVFTLDVLLYNVGEWISKLKKWEINCYSLFDIKLEKNVNEELLSDSISVYNEIHNLNPFRSSFNPFLYLKAVQTKDKLSAFKKKFIKDLNFDCNDVPEDLEMTMLTYTEAYKQIFDLPINNEDKMKVCSRYDSLNWINKASKAFESNLSYSLVDELVREGLKLKKEDNSKCFAFNIENLYQPLNSILNSIHEWVKKEDVLVNRYGIFESSWREYVIAHYDNVFQSNFISSNSINSENLEAYSSGLKFLLWKREVEMIFKILDSSDYENILIPSHLEFLYNEAISNLSLHKDDKNVLKLKEIAEKARALEIRCNIVSDGKLMTTKSSLISIKLEIDSMKINCPSSAKIMHLIKSIDWGIKANEILKKKGLWIDYQDLNNKMIKLKFSANQLLQWKEDAKEVKMEGEDEDFHIGMLFNVHEKFIKAYNLNLLFFSRCKRAIAASKSEEGVDFYTVQNLLSDNLLNVFSPPIELIESLRDIKTFGTEWSNLTLLLQTQAKIADTKVKRLEIINLLKSQIQKLELLFVTFNESFTKECKQTISSVRWAVKARDLLDKMESDSPPSSEPYPTLPFLIELLNTRFKVDHYKEFNELRNKIEVCNDWIKKVERLLLSGDPKFKELKTLVENHEEIKIYIPMIELLYCQINFIASGGLDGTSLKKFSSKNQFKIENEIAWAKFNGYPFWPCIVTSTSTKSMEYGQREIKLLGIEKIVEINCLRMRPWENGNPLKEPLEYPELKSAIEQAEKIFRERKKNDENNKKISSRSSSDLPLKKMKKEEGTFGDPRKNTRRNQFLEKLISKLNSERLKTYGNTFSNAEDCKRLGELIEIELFKKFTFPPEMNRANYTNTAKVILALFKSSNNSLIKKLFTGEVQAKRFVGMDEKEMSSFESSKCVKTLPNEKKIPKSSNIVKPLILFNSNLPGCSNSSFDAFSVKVFLQYKKETNLSSSFLNQKDKKENIENRKDVIESLPIFNFEMDCEGEEEEFQKEYSIDVEFQELEEESGVSFWSMNEFGL